MKFRDLIFSLTLCAFCNITALPVVAANEFEIACKFYNEKQYTRARPLLEAVTAKYPAYWPGHYYLAHTFLALGQKGRARQEYELCLAGKPAPSADITGACRKIISTLGGAVEGDRGELPDFSPGTDSDKPIGIKVEKAGFAPTAQETDKSWRRKSIQDNCDRDVAILKAELKDRTGPDSHLSEDERTAVTKEYDDKILAIQDRARAQIQALK